MENLLKIPCGEAQIQHCGTAREEEVVVWFVL